jgi:hypothetical protein
MAIIDDLIKTISGIGTLIQIEDYRVKVSISDAHPLEKNRVDAALNEREKAIRARKFAGIEISEGDKA